MNGSVLMLASEVAPFAKTGGLADVSAALTRDLHRRGTDVRLWMPLYRRIREGDWELRPDPELGTVSFRLGSRTWSFTIQRVRLPGSEAEVYLADCPELFDRDDIYDGGGDEHLRFAAFSRCALEASEKLGWFPDVVHCNDWHTGLVPLYFEVDYRSRPRWRDTRTVLTIHNIGYQGEFSVRHLGELGLAGHKGLLHQGDLQRGSLNFLKTAVIYANALTTVSETYAREIQTFEYGMGLDDLLRSRAEALVGIVNGVDYAEWDPRNDRWIRANYSSEDLGGKRECKEDLLSSAGLEFAAGIPVFGIVSRLTAQKGFELLGEVLPTLLAEEEIQLAVLGSGEAQYERFFQDLRDRHPEKVAFYAGYNNELAHRIEAGCDLFVMPSRYEPCGLNQMYSLRYGTPPIVRKTGGLADTVEPFDAVTGRGNGFVFEGFSPGALGDSMREAIEVFEDGDAWSRIVLNGMGADWSWDRQGEQYVELYERLRSG